MKYYSNWSVSFQFPLQDSSHSPSPDVPINSLTVGSLHQITDGWWKNCSESQAWGFSLIPIWNSVCFWGSPFTKDTLMRKHPETPTKRDQDFRKRGLIGLIRGLMDLSFNVRKTEESCERPFQYTKGYCKEKWDKFRPVFHDEGRAWTGMIGASFSPRRRRQSCIARGW